MADAQDSPKVPESGWEKVTIYRRHRTKPALMIAGSARLADFEYETYIPASALLSDEVVEVLAQRRADSTTLPVGMDLESYEAHLAKHGREDEGFRAEARADLQIAIEQVGGGQGG